MGATVLENRFGSVSLTLTPAAVTSLATSAQSFTCSGILATDVILSCVKPTPQTGLGIVNVRCSSANNIEITFMNCTASPITPTAAEAYKVQWMRPDGGTRTTIFGT